DVGLGKPAGGRGRNRTQVRLRRYGWAVVEAREGSGPAPARGRARRRLAAESDSDPRSDPRNLGCISHGCQGLEIVPTRFVARGYTGVKSRRTAFPRGLS